MAINIVETIYSETGVFLDLDSTSTTATTVGEALKQFYDDNSSNENFKAEYVSFSTESLANTNLSSLGTFTAGNGQEIGVWRLRENHDAGDTEVTLEKYQSGNVFTHLVPEDYETFAMSSELGTHIYQFPPNPDPSAPQDIQNGFRNKAQGTQDALTSTPNTIANNDRYSVFGSRFDDDITGSRRSDQIRGRGGSDTIDAGRGNDFVTGGGGADLLLGGAGNDRLRGGTGNDRLRGQTGEDELMGGRGSDFLVGGNDTDFFIYNLDDMTDAIDNASSDTINDFSTADGELIILEDGIEAFSFDDRALADINDVVFRNLSNGSTSLYTRANFDGAGFNGQFVEFADVVGATLSETDFLTV